MHACPAARSMGHDTLTLDYRRWPWAAENDRLEGELGCACSAFSLKSFGVVSRKFDILASRSSEPGEANEQNNAFLFSFGIDFISFHNFLVPQDLSFPLNRPMVGGTGGRGRGGCKVSIERLAKIAAQQVCSALLTGQPPIPRPSSRPLYPSPSLSINAARQRALIGWLVEKVQIFGCLALVSASRCWF